MAEYDIYLNNARRVYDWIVSQPNLITIQPFNPDKIYAEFNHTPGEQARFKEDLMERFMEIDIGGNTFELLLPQLRHIKTDQYFYGIDQPVTKNNVGTTYTNIYTDFQGRPFFIDTTGFTRMAIQIFWTKGVGTGIQTMRIVNNADDTQIVESGSLGTVANQADEFTNVNIPLPFRNFIGKWRLQCKSTVGADDPVFAGFRLYLRR